MAGYCHRLRLKSILGHVSITKLPKGIVIGKIIIVFFVIMFPSRHLYCGSEQQMRRIILTPQNYQDEIRNISSYCNLIFEEGAYSGPIILKDLNHVTFSATEKTIFTSNVRTPLSPYNLTISYPKKYDDIRSTFVLKNSNHITFRNLEFNNTAPYIKSDLDRQIGSSFYVVNSENILIENCRYYSHGKLALILSHSKSVRINASKIEGLYFLLSVNFSVDVFVSSTTFIQTYGSYDYHTVLWSVESSQEYRDCTFYSADHALLSGLNYSDNRVIVSGDTKGTLGAWIRTHPNYKNLHVVLRDNYPKNVEDFFVTGTNINCKVTRE